LKRKLRLEKCPLGRKNNEEKQFLIFPGNFLSRKRKINFFHSGIEEQTNNDLPWGDSYLYKEAV